MRYKKLSVKRFIKKCLLYLFGLIAIALKLFSPIFTKEKSKKILILSFWGMGDSIQQTPIFFGLKEKYFDYKIDVVSSKRSRDYLNYLDIFDNVYTDLIPWSKKNDKYKFFSNEYFEFFKFIKRLRNENYEIALSARPDTRDYILLLLINPKVLFCNSLYFGKFIGKLKTKFERNDNKVEYIKRVCSELDINFNYKLKNLKKLKEKKISIFIDSNDPTKEIDLDLILNSIENIEFTENFEINIISQKPEILYTKLLEKYSNVKVKNTNIFKDLIDELSSSSYFIGSDSGPAHLASIIGVQSLVIFTSGTPFEDTPYNSTSIFLDNFACRPCAGHCIYKKNYCKEGIYSIEMSEHFKNFFEKNQKDSKKATQLIPLTVI